MFTPTNLFKGVACPENDNCKLINCIFSHEPQKPHASTALRFVDNASPNPTNSHATEPPTKRRRITYDKLEDKPLSRAEQIRAQLAGSRKEQSQAASNTARAITSLERAVTPPPKASAKDRSTDIAPPGDQTSPWVKLKTPDPGKVESLNPRVLKPAPDSHAKRVLYLQHIHSNIARLNRELRSATSPVADMDIESMKAFVLSDQEMIRLALDEEETIGTDKPKIYSNTIRNCVAAYSKMKLPAWLSKLTTMKVSGENASLPNGAVRAGKRIGEGLPQGQEHLLLPHLVLLDQASLSQFGYISTPPSEAEALEAAKTTEMSGNHEQCERCGSRFKLFPNRNPETGLLTSNGPCRYHWARKIFPSKQKTDSYTGSNEAIYPCCGQSIGTEGCTKHEDHVYKANAASRLAAVAPFIDTPHNPSPKADQQGKAIRAVVFDCEMGYTTNGMELLRLTAMTWPEGQLLVDVLVRPLGTIIDLNTRFSGIKPEHISTAVPYVEGAPVTPQAGQMVIVDRLDTARQLLCDFITPETPLMGHAIDNDLNTTRLCHPTVVDTVLLYSHPRGLPYRYGLKMLSKKHLNRDIQMGGSSGHDSKEDAAATGDLITLKAADTWADLKTRGWSIDNGRLVRPNGDVSVIGWQVAPKTSTKSKPAVQDNGLAKIIEEARSANPQPSESLTTDFLES